MSLILLVEDHEPMRSALTTMLRQMGHEVVAVGNGHEALAAQKTRSADILLTDIFMPEMDGYELLQQFRQLYPSARLIAMSGGMPRNPGGPFLDIAQKFGARWLLPKPFTAKQLAEVIRAAAEESLEPGP